MEVPDVAQLAQFFEQLARREDRVWRYKGAPPSGERGTRIHPLAAVTTMPTCPKCGKMISAQRYSRHLQRCGSTHKNKSKVLDHPDNFWMKI